MANDSEAEMAFDGGPVMVTYAHKGPGYSLVLLDHKRSARNRQDKESADIDNANNSNSRICQPFRWIALRWGYMVYHVYASDQHCLGMEARQVPERALYQLDDTVADQDIRETKKITFRQDQTSTATICGTRELQMSSESTERSKISRGQP